MKLFTFGISTSKHFLSTSLVVFQWTDWDIGHSSFNSHYFAVACNYFIKCVISLWTLYSIYSVITEPCSYAIISKLMVFPARTGLHRLWTYFVALIGLIAVISNLFEFSRKKPNTFLRTHPAQPIDSCFGPIILISFHPFQKLTRPSTNLFEVILINEIQYIFSEWIITDLFAFCPTDLISNTVIFCVCFAGFDYPFENRR